MPNQQIAPRYLGPRHSLRNVLRAVLAVAALYSSPAAAQTWGDSLVKNTRVFPSTTRVVEVVGQMRNITSALGVRCTYCHLGSEDIPIDKYDFASDQKQTKLVAREMMRMVREINQRLDSLPGREAGLQVTCMTCHRGIPRPAPLETVIQEAAQAGGADSAVRAYRALRAKFYGRAAYDFGESSLNVAAFRLGRARRFDDALAVLDLNATQFPGSSGMEVFRGNILLMRGDTTAAANAYREAIRRDTANAEARGRLTEIDRRRPTARRPGEP